MKKRKPVRAVIDTNLFVSGLFANQGYSYQLQQLWIDGAFELAISEQILKEIENTLLKPHIRKRLFLEEGEQAAIISLIKEKATVVTTDLYQTRPTRSKPTPLTTNFWPAPSRSTPIILSPATITCWN